MTVGGDLTLSLRDVGKRFGSNWVVQDLSLDVAPGTIVGLIGPSGCGKTTTIRLATGIHQPDQGEVELLGHPPAELPDELRARIGYLPQEPVLFDELSLRENLTFHASLNGVQLRRRRHLRQLLELVALWDDRRTLVRNASGGMKRRLALAAALVHEPAFVLLDEPTAGIDPILRQHLWSQFRELRDEGRSLVITTQYVSEAADCDIVVLLSAGHVAAAGSPEELRRAALGGDLIEVETARPLGAATLDELRLSEGTRSVSMASATRARLVVDDGGAALPAVLQHLEARDYEVIDSEEVVIGYDEVFIRLVEREQRETSR